MRLTIELERATDMTEETEETWISHCLEIDCVSQGPSPRDAIVMVVEAIDMMVSDEIAALESSGQIEDSGWERAFGNIADEVSPRALTPPVVSIETIETKDRDSIAALRSEVEQLRTEVRVLRAQLAEGAGTR